MDISTFVGALLVASTTVLMGSIGAQLLVARSPAARHAISFWAIVVISACPAVVLITHRWPEAAVLPSTIRSTVIEVATAAVETTAVAASPHVEYPAWTQHREQYLGGLWLAGVLLGVVRIAHGLHVARRLRAGAEPLAGPTVVATCGRLNQHFDVAACPVLASRELAVPLTVGLFRPVVIVPLSLAEQLDQDQLLQVLLHETAHARPTDYARTLLLVARSLVPASHPSGLMTLLGSAPQLHRRVASLLNPGRDTMTHLKTWKVAMIAATFLGGLYVLTSVAAPVPEKSAGYDVSQRVDFQVGATYLRGGDSITIEDIQGTSNAIAVGNVYVVKGTYKLASAKSATLSAFTTTSARDHRMIPTQNTQTMKVDEGEGRFSLIFYMWQHGNPHLSFYPAEGGSSFASVYFGSGDTLLKRGWWE